MRFRNHLTITLLVIQFVCFAKHIKISITAKLVIKIRNCKFS